MLFYVFTNLNLIFFNIKKIHFYTKINYLKKIFFLNRYFKLNDLIWQEGLLLDFLQKKSSDIWLKKFLIYTSYLFNEKYLFEKITRFFINFFIIPSHKFFIFEINNVSNLLFFNVFFFIFFLFFLTSFYLFQFFI